LTLKKHLRGGSLCAHQRCGSNPGLLIPVSQIFDFNENLGFPKLEFQQVENNFLNRPLRPQTVAFQPPRPANNHTFKK